MFMRAVSVDMAGRDARQRDAEDNCRSGGMEGCHRGFDTVVVVVVVAAEEQLEGFVATATFFTVVVVLVMMVSAAAAFFIAVVGMDVFTIETV